MTKVDEEEAQRESLQKLKDRGIKPPKKEIKILEDEKWLNEVKNLLKDLLFDSE